MADRFVLTEGGRWIRGLRTTGGTFILKNVNGGVFLSEHALFEAHPNAIIRWEAKGRGTHYIASQHAEGDVITRLIDEGTPLAGESTDDIVATLTAALDKLIQPDGLHLLDLGDSARRLAGVWREASRRGLVIADPRGSDGEPDAAE